MFQKNNNNALFLVEAIQKADGGAIIAKPRPRPLPRRRQLEPSPPKTIGSSTATSESNHPVVLTSFVSYHFVEENTNNKNPNSFTSLGGGDDDNNNNNNNNPRPGFFVGTRWEMMVWFVLGSFMTIPMTEYCIDPLTLLWGMATFGWFLSSSSSATDVDNNNEKQQQNQDTNTIGTRRLNLRFIGIQSGMILLGDWMIRLWKFLSSLYFSTVVGTKKAAILTATTTSTNRSNTSSSGLWQVVAILLQFGAIATSIVIQHRIVLQIDDDDDDDYENVVTPTTSPTTSAAASKSKMMNKGGGTIRKSSLSWIVGGIGYGGWDYYYCRYCLEYVALVVPLILLAFEFVSESDILWRLVHGLCSRHHQYHQSTSSSSPFQSLLFLLGTTSSSS
eukprot:scaffold10086_cov72-Cylindrotheca_fusiformis.AAC.2